MLCDDRNDNGNGSNNDCVYSLAKGPQQLRVRACKAERLFGAIYVGLQVRIEHLRKHGTGGCE